MNQATALRIKSDHLEAFQSQNTFSVRATGQVATRLYEDVVEKFETDM